MPACALIGEASLQAQVLPLKKSHFKLTESDFILLDTANNSPARVEPEQRDAGAASLEASGKLPEALPQSEMAALT